MIVNLDIDFLDRSTFMIQHKIAINVEVRSCEQYSFQLKGTYVYFLTFANLPSKWQTFEG